jgi:DNA-binding SARP family transcriptional activator
MAERRYRLLGGLQVEVDGTPVDLGTHKQRALLAVLLLADGRAVGTDTLVDEVWGEAAPHRVEASLQSYVSSLRRVLEPDRPPRGPATALVTRGTAYALIADRDDVDVRRFADLVARGRAAARADDQRVAADLLREALALYAPLLPEFAGEPFHATAAEHLDRLHLSALELSYEARLALGEHQLLVPDLESAVRRHPLHEGLWALLAIARYRVGRQSDALQAVADCKRLLAEEIGVDPGPRLRQLEADLLAQAPHLDPPGALPQDEALPRGVDESPRLVGRAEELTLLRAAVADAATGRDRVILVEGEPGVGKTRLLEEVAGRGHRDSGVNALWGRCIEGDGAPALWPWLQVLADALSLADGADRERVVHTELGRLLDPDADAARPSVLPDAGARFRLFDQAADLLVGIARSRPLVVVVDDVQWADQASLDLLVHVAAARLPRVVVIAALRDRAPVPSAALSLALGTLSGLPSHRRLVIGALGKDEVAALIEQQTGDRPATAVAESIHRRTEGNPFYVRELARLLQEDGALDEAAFVSGRGVPAGVRDVVRSRVQAAGPQARRLLELAAVIGRDIDLDLLARAAETSVDEALSRLEPAVDLGLVGPHPEAPFAFRFSHDLVRESIAESVPSYLGIRLHLAVADALEGTHIRRVDSAERLAHHLWSAGPLAAPARTGSDLLEAGRLALRRYSYDAARRHLELAAVVAQSGGEPELELEVVALLTTVVGVQQGYVGSALDLLEQAEQLATKLGRHRRAADFLYTRWAAHSQGVNLPEAARLAERMYRLGLASDDVLLKVYGYHAKGVDAWDHGRIGEAHRHLMEAESHLARQLTESQEEDLLRVDLTLLVPAFLGFMTAFVGDVEGGRERFRLMDGAIGSGPYPVVVWSAFAGVSAAYAGDPQWAREVAARGIAADPQFEFVFLGTYIRIVEGWARARLGDDPERAVEEIQTILDGMPRDQPLSGEGSWWSLFADACLAAGQPERALAALDHAARAMSGHGQVSPEPLRLLVLARYQHAVGAPDAVVRATLDEVRADAAAREAFLFTDRADRLEAELLGRGAQAPSTRSR